MSAYSFFRRLVLFGTPLALGVLELFHPTATTGDALTDLGHHLPIWMAVHILQLPLFGLMALAVYFLLGSASGMTATTSRIALGFFLVFYIAFDTMAGIAAGMALDSAVGQSPEYQQGLLHLFDELNFSPIALAINALGALGWVVSVVGAAFVARQAGAPRFAIICLLLSTMFAMHPPPTGPLGLVFFLVAAAGIEFSKQSIKTSIPIAAD